MGIKILNALPIELAIPDAVPRISDGKASGVQAYKMELNIDWEKYSMALIPT